MGACVEAWSAQSWRPNVVDLADIVPPADRALVDCLDRPLDETLRLLSIAGLNDAFLFLRRPGELSDGQRYRLRLALALAAGADVILIDEFCSTLDRTTARIIAWQVRKFAARTGTAFIVATAHDDLFEDLRPDIYIEKLFGARVAVSPPAPVSQARPVSQAGPPGGGDPSRAPAAGRRVTAATVCEDPVRPCSVLDDLRIDPADRSAWDALAAFHYRGGDLPPHSHIFAATVPTPHRLGPARRVVAVIVYGFPSLGNRLRNHATRGRYARGTSRRQAARLLNREVRTISRVVVDPQYRGLGLAVGLVRETMPLVGTPYVEALAQMARVNPFFERAGMTRYDAPPPEAAGRLIAALEHCRIPQAVAAAPAALAQRIQQLDAPRRALLWKELRAWFNRYESAKTSKTPDYNPHNIINTVAQHLFSNPVYYLWKRPDINRRDAGDAEKSTPSADFAD